MNYQVELPENMNKGSFIGEIYLTDPGKQYHMKLENAISIEYDGYLMKTGHVFEYANSGLLFLH